MVDVFSKEKRSEVMSRIRAKDTKPELYVRKLLHSFGFRYRLHKKNLPGKPDIVLSKYKTVIFVHGCFWHGHSCKYGSEKRMPKSNIEYWKKKFEKNKELNKIHMRELKKKGWRIILIWECELKKEKTVMRKLRPLFD